MTHLGQRLSALIDGELDGSERERVLLHMAKCGSCREEVAALRMLKRRMNELGEAAAGAALTGRLMRLRESGMADGTPVADVAWPPPPAPRGWEFGGDGARPEQRAGRYFLAGSLVVFLAGLGTAAFIAGGEAQAQAPSPPVAPSVDVLVVPRGANAHDSGLRPQDATHTVPTASSPALPQRLR